MKIAIVQPYFFPYIGYFQLINAVDKFIFFDDVNYINRGWVNRNSFLINDRKKMITLPCKRASQNKMIKEIFLVDVKKVFEKILKMVRTSYYRAPYFNQVYPLFKSVMEYENRNIARFAGNSVLEVINYLGLTKEVKYSSAEFPDTRGMNASDRLIEVTKRENGSQYVNPIGGMNLYNKEYFKSKGIDLFFLKGETVSYPQFSGAFIPDLSILDVLMFNSIQETKALLNKYQLI